MVQTVALVQSQQTDPISHHIGIHVTPGLVSVNADSKLVEVEIQNVGTEILQRQPTELYQVTLEHCLPSHTMSNEAFLNMFSFDSLEDSVPNDILTSLSALSLANKTTFSTLNNDIGCTSVVKYPILLTDNTPFKEKSRRIPADLYEEVRQHLKQMISTGVVMESSIPWASNVVLVRKKNLRFCIEFRKLNSRTIRNAHLLPRIKETLDYLNEACRFSSLDLCSGYWQVVVEEADKHKTAFTVGPMGFYGCN